MWTVSPWNASKISWRSWFRAWMLGFGERRCLKRSKIGLTVPFCMQMSAAGPVSAAFGYPRIAWNRVAKRQVAWRQTVRRWCTASRDRSRPSRASPTTKADSWRCRAHQGAGIPLWHKYRSVMSPSSHGWFVFTQYLSIFVRAHKQDMLWQRRSYAVWWQRSSHHPQCGHRHHGSTKRTWLSLEYIIIQNIGTKANGSALWVSF